MDSRLRGNDGLEYLLSDVKRPFPTNYDEPNVHLAVFNEHYNTVRHILYRGYLS